MFAKIHYDYNHYITIEIVWHFYSFIDGRTGIMCRCYAGFSSSLTLAFTNPALTNRVKMPRFFAIIFFAISNIHKYSQIVSSLKSSSIQYR